MKGFSCRLCPKTFRRMAYLQKHIKMVHAHETRKPDEDETVSEHVIVSGADLAKNKEGARRRFRKVAIRQTSTIVSPKRKCGDSTRALTSETHVQTTNTSVMIDDLKKVSCNSQLVFARLTVEVPLYR